MDLSLQMRKDEATSPTPICSHFPQTLGEGRRGATGVCTERPSHEFPEEGGGGPGGMLVTGHRMAPAARRGLYASPFCVCQNISCCLGPQQGEARDIALFSHAFLLEFHQEL